MVDRRTYKELSNGRDGNMNKSICFESNTEKAVTNYFDKLQESCRTCKNCLSSAQCEMCEDGDMYVAADYISSEAMEGRVAQ